jgi:hypothetical protein
MDFEFQQGQRTSNRKYDGHSAEYCPHHCLPVVTGIAAGLSIFLQVINHAAGLIWWWKIHRFTYYCLLNDIGTATCFRQWR